MKKQQTMTYRVFGILVLLFSQYVMAETSGGTASDDNYMQLQTASKKVFSAYVVGPENAKKGLLLIHGWWGLTRDVEAWANQFAVKGYRVMAIDLYNRQTTKQPAKARQLMASVLQSVANEKYMAAIQALSAPGRKLAVIGRSYGGAQALHAASIGQGKIAAVIIYYPYGEIITDKQILSSIKAPVLGHFANQDFFLTPEKFKHFQSTMVKAGVNMSFKIYNARHGFDNRAGKNYDAQAGGLAMERTYQFLNKKLNE